MATLPSASVSLSDTAGGFASGVDRCVVICPVATNADSTPREFSSAAALLTQHGFAPGVEYASEHIDETGLPVLFVGIPIATAAAKTHEDSSSKTGTSKISVAAGADGYLDEIDCIVTVTTGGTIGTTGIVFDLSCDGNRTKKAVRLGTASSYTIPYLGAVLSFGTGTLVAGDVYKFRTSAPMWDSAGLLAARQALAAQQKAARSWLIAGDVANSTFAGYVTTQANAYETANDRFIYARASVKDRLPLPKMSKVKKVMVGTPSLTFAEVGATGDTITRATGSWTDEGFEVGDLITVSGSASNNFTDAKVTGVSATVLTLDTQDLVDEVTAAAAVIGSAAVTFAEVGGTGDTITRSSGSFVTEGFAVGDTITVSGTASNNITQSAAITGVTATVITLDTDDLAAEAIAAHRITIEKVHTKASWISAADTTFASVDAQKRIDLSAGRARKLSPITGWSPRRPAMWAVSIREYQHDIHRATWRKEDGPLDGWSMLDTNGNLSDEFDERVDGGALSARFTCLRSWANGPNGAFVALSLTRATEGSILSRTHNMSVANHAMSIVQAQTENAIGVDLVLKTDGTAEEASLSVIEAKVNTKLEEELLKEKVSGEGPRASSVVWRASRTDVLNTVPATMTGVLTLIEKGTIEQIDTTTKVS